MKKSLPTPRSKYGVEAFNEMALKLHLDKLRPDLVPELILWRRHLRDLRNIVKGARDAHGNWKGLPEPNSGICVNIAVLAGVRNHKLHPVNLIAASASVWPVYQALYEEGYVATPTFPIPDKYIRYPASPTDGDYWSGLALSYRLSLIDFTIRLITTYINQLKAKPA